MKIRFLLKTLASGVDFLGWIHFGDHRVLRTSTKRRMIKNIQSGYNYQSRASYLGLLKHGNMQRLILKKPEVSLLEFYRYIVCELQGRVIYDSMNLNLWY